MSMISRAVRFLAVLMAGSGGFGFTEAGEVRTVQSMELTLRPVSDGQNITEIVVAQTLRGLGGKAGTPLFGVPVRITTVMGQPYGEGDVVAADDAGPLPLTISVPPPDPAAPIEMRLFTPARDVSGAVVLRYRAKVVPAMSPRKPGPSYDLRGVDNAVGGALFSFLLLPVMAPHAYHLTLNWDLSALPSGARGVTTRGEGTLDALIASEELTTVFFLAGMIDGDSSPGKKFHAYWMGMPPFDPTSNADWMGRMFSVLEEFFQQPSEYPYYFLMRPFPLPRDGGGATRNGFMLEYGTGDLSIAARRFMFAHEMIHHLGSPLVGLFSYMRLGKADRVFGGWIAWC